MATKATPVQSSPAAPAQEVPAKYQLDEGVLQQLYCFVDSIPLSRPKRNINRDFSDGVLMAEVVKHFLPKLVDTHNYSSANGVAQKLYNWEHLNNKVFKKMHFQLTKPDIDRICNCVPGAIEWTLLEWQKALEAFQSGQKHAPGSPNTSPYGDPNAVAAAAAASAPGFAGMAAMGGLLTPEQLQQQLQLQQLLLLQQAAAAQAAGGVAPAPGPAAPPAGAGAAAGAATLQTEVDSEILLEKEQSIQELKATVGILETKIRKLEQLVQLKEARIQTLTAKLQQAGIQ